MSTIINIDSLVHHLEVAARAYTVQADHARSAVGGGHAYERMAQQLERQASECREWVAALQDIRSLGFSGDDIEIDRLSDH